ncbi:hypothetical protein A4H97_33410 [Niastella yeongjuensis]|uniref:Translation elongation factor EFTu/EF1A C-terminal domain-containing protein n=1 Tax=Niastella yeongjuensis TaxID=354355 RepID=A0A1V9EDQ3_9BACT|nr:hypothetical protein [Niastella yeongjuensis]OQP44253.1 hypothetical protein A4H97_33410 [Niastella yeongjuensis]SEO41276.1 hypothetical protein SAMN05660816_02856 [Niastella yeongjuensis]
MAILKKIEGNELYLYMNGNLIYKRWLDTGQSKVFDIMAYDKYTLTSIRDLEYENPGELISVKARLKLKSTEEGGRQTGFISGYRPNHVFEYPDDGKLLQTFIGDIILDSQATFEPGEEGEVTVRFLINQPIEKYLEKGRVWWIQEGARQIGQAEII